VFSVTSLNRGVSTMSWVDWEKYISHDRNQNWTAAWLLFLNYCPCIGLCFLLGTPIWNRREMAGWMWQ